MNETVSLMLSFVAGGILGTLFFGALWLTVRNGLSYPQPALWFLGSFLLRMGTVLGGFYFVSSGNWKRMLLCLIGFVSARLSVTWKTRQWQQRQARPTLEVTHAPHS